MPTTARALGAVHITFLGTEPIRRAADAARIVAEVERATGVPLHVLSHEEEAYLTLVGVTEGLPVTHETLVVDVGGGSSEFCVVAAGRRRPRGRPPARLGRLIDRLRDERSADPAELACDGRGRATRSCAERSGRRRRELVAVGGTASNLLKVTPGRRSPTGSLTRERIAEALRRSSPPSRPPTPPSAIGVNPTRARLLPAGAVIVDALCGATASDSVRVSEAGIREGAILVAEHAGRAGATGSPELAHGWRQLGPLGVATYSPATTRPSVRRKRRPATPRHGAPIVRRRRATSRSRSTR